MAKFGLDQIGNVTPRWSKNLFMIYFIVSKPIVAYLSASAVFTSTKTHEITLFISLFTDPIIFAVSKMFGIEPAIRQEDVEKVADDINKKDHE